MSRQQSESDPERSESGIPGEPPERSAVDDAEDRDEPLRQQLKDASTAALRKVEARTPEGVTSRLRAFRERIRSRRSLDTAWRMLVLALGVTLLVAGLIMFVIPGPGFATIILGLVVLGSEFTWATRALNPVKEAARRASEAALDPRRRRRNLIIGGIAGVLIGVGLWWYLTVFGLTLDPLMDLLSGVVGWFTGLFD